MGRQGLTAEAYLRGQGGGNKNDKNVLYAHLTFYNMLVRRERHLCNGSYQKKLCLPCPSFSRKSPEQSPPNFAQTSTPTREGS